MRFALLLVFAVLVALPLQAAEVRTTIEIARSYPDGGGYNKSWEGSGSPEALVHQDETILPVCEGGTFCCGYTLAVAFRAAEERGLLEGKSPAAVKRFQKDWFGVPDGPDRTLCAYAMEQLGIGRQVPLEEAEPGDFVQLWRKSGSGHSVLFLHWVEEEGRRVGFRYRSSQGSTDGIADRTEYFSDDPQGRGSVLWEDTYAGRLDASAE